MIISYVKKFQGIKWCRFHPVPGPGSGPFRPISLKLVIFMYGPFYPQPPLNLFGEKEYILRKKNCRESNGFGLILCRAREVFHFAPLPLNL